MWEWVGFCAVAPLFLVVAFLATQTGPLARHRHVVMWGALFRILGTLVGYLVIYRVYDGFADAVGYFEYGRQYAAHVQRFDFAFVIPDVGRWWGTHFIESVAAFVVAIVGPSERGSSLVFSLLSFAGMLLAARAFLRTVPSNGRPYLLYCLLFAPSLWFWTAIMGKEPLIICALGMSFAGYIGDGRRPGWLLLSVGALFAFAIRPHVGALLVIAVAGAPFLAPARWSLGRVSRALALGALAAGVFVVAIRTLGVENTNVGGVRDFQQNAAANTVTGGSQIEQGRGGPAAVPLAFVSALARPFPWEAGNPLALLSALEVMAFWALAISRSRGRRWLAGSWRRHAPTRVALVFALLYAPLIGMTMFNLGILVRQRVILWFPLFFVAEGALALARRPKVGCDQAQRLVLGSRALIRVP